jgi:hypothetical protein
MSTIVFVELRAMSLTRNVDPFFFGGRNVIRAYDFAKARPATELTPTFQLD